MGGGWYRERRVGEGSRSFSEGILDCGSECEVFDCSFSSTDGSGASFCMGDECDLVELWECGYY